ncbi:hypothetical protein AMECASPLE_033115 [Ameca splendens]|uniref:Uncharacterized protein n=1 Tax=Ameca splendens TaxID=208324 RepID=A0ABV0YTQ7_9TELE
MSMEKRNRGKGSRRGGWQSFHLTASYTMTEVEYEQIPGLHLQDLLLLKVLQAAALRCESGSPGMACRAG